MDAVIDRLTKSQTLFLATHINPDGDAIGSLISLGLGLQQSGKQIYMYNEMEMLAGDGTYINPGLLHALLTNWVGRRNHPLGMEADPGKEKWNYPIYGYATTSASRGRNRVEVKMTRPETMAKEAKPKGRDNAGSGSNAG